MKKEYISYMENKGYPAGKNIYYECTLCNTDINSMPKHFDSCKCGNIEIDATVGRVIIKDKNNFKIFKRKQLKRKANPKGWLFFFKSSTYPVVPVYLQE